MMYQVTCDGYVLYDPRDERLRITNPTLTLEDNKAGTLVFTVHVTHPYYDYIHKLRSDIKVYRDDTLVWKGRVLTDEKDFYNSRTITCEGALAYLLDSTIRPFEYQGPLSGFFTKIIEEHNAQVNPSQRFIIGDVTVVDTNDYINRSSVNHMHALDALDSRLLKTNGGHLRVRYDADEKPILDYLADFTDTSTQTIEFSQNLTGLDQMVSADTTYTAVIPLGAKLTDIDPTYEGDERLTIASVNEGRDYIINDTLAAEYGVIYAPTSQTTWEDVTLAQNLKSKGLAYLTGQAISLSTKIQIDAVDLHGLDPSVEGIWMHDYVHVVSKPHAIDAVYLVSKLEVPIDSPADMRITIGKTDTSMLGQQAEQGKNVEDRVGRIEADYTTSDRVTSIAQEAIRSNTSILQSAEQIMMEALQEYTKTQDFEHLQETVQTQFTVMAGQIEARFTETVSQIVELGGETTQRFDTISKYVRFIGGDIVLGQSDSEIKLRIENDILYFFTGADDMADPGTALAYFASGKLYINEANIVTSLQLGNFSFLPRSNGNLSFKKVMG